MSISTTCPNQVFLFSHQSAKRKTVFPPWEKTKDNQTKNGKFYSYLGVVLSLVANVGLIPVSMPCLHQSFSSIFAALFALLLWRPRGYHDNGTWLRRERRSTSILIRGREAARQLLLHVHVMESFEKPLHRRRATIHDHWFSKCSQIEAMNKPRVVVPTTTSSFVSSSSDCNFYVAKSPIRFTLEKNLKPEIFQKKNRTHRQTQFGDLLYRSGTRPIRR